MSYEVIAEGYSPANTPRRLLSNTTLEAAKVYLFDLVGEEVVDVGGIAKKDDTEPLGGVLINYPEENDAQVKYYIREEKDDTCPHCKGTGVAEG